MNHTIITSAGIGKRMKAKENKIMLSLADKPLLYWTTKVFEESDLIDEIIIVVHKDDIEEIKDLVKKYNFKKIKKIVEGGKERQDSVYNGLKAIDGRDDDIILIHNGANPFVSEKVIKDVINATEECGAAGPGIKAPDTVKEVDKDNFVTKTLDRSKLWHMHTPQGIKFNIAMEAFKKAYEDRFYGTDDLTLVEKLGKKVKIVESNVENIKITYPYDLKFGNILKNSIKVGIGQDSHKFTDEDKLLMLAGIEIKGEKGLEANSDGDVILHSLFNAIASTIGEHSIGYYADDMCKNGITDSKEYLKVILKKLKEKEYEINNVGVTIECKTPKILPIEDRLKESLTKLLKIKKEQIGITATSGEGLSEFGKGKGIQCFSIVGVKKI